MTRRIALVYFGYLVVAVLFLGPVVFMVLSSFHRNIDINVSPPKLDAALTLTNYRKLFDSLPFGRYILNSILVAGLSTAIAVVIGTPAAFVLARLQLRSLAFFTLLARMAPGVLFVVPLYLMSVSAGAPGNDLVNYLFLIFAHLIITLPLTIWLVLPYFESIPAALDEAALIDGATLRERFARVALPLVVPGLAVAVVISFIFSWNYFLFALALANTNTVTLPVIAFNFIGQGAANWGGLMAAASMISVPAFLLALFAQKLLVRGIVSGAVK
ncbi:MAG TPA: carbohydrate ABC transporter permease [Mycobacteriales bacterium]|nr:carbohydrate ABC transporter permease [Mycobacteriales bacterium]